VKDGQKRCWDRRMKKGFRWVAGGRPMHRRWSVQLKMTVERHALE